MTRQFLITRPMMMAERTRRRLHQLGWDGLIAPMVRIVPTPAPMADSTEAGVIDPTATGYQAVLITSQHGLQQWVLGGALGGALEEVNRALPLFCVGGASATLAKNLGFRQVVAAAGNADALASLVIDKLNPQAGALLHPTGQGFRAQGWRRLIAAGFRIDQPKLYRQQAIGQLPHEAVDAMLNDRLNAVLFYAPRSASLYQQLAIQAGLTAAHRGLSALCLSTAVAMKVGRELETIPPSQARQPHKNSHNGLGWQRILVAKQPTEESLLEQLVEVWGRP
ncbi:MAG: uroporphyrinogen-III synthase [Alphaproteobacteria bacterium]|nr:uroporphyrinogen-III synthase [Alphaproteobacteria bacterium]